jgi:hypothetical protein
VDSFPESVYEFGAWLKAHPWVTRVRVPLDTFERYCLQLDANAMVVTKTPWPSYHFTWRHKVAAIVDHAWPHRREIWPSHVYRGR